MITADTTAITADSGMATADGFPGALARSATFRGRKMMPPEYRWPEIEQPDNIPEKVEDVQLQVEEAPLVQKNPVLAMAFRKMAMKVLKN